FRSSDTPFLGPVPAIDEQVDPTTASVFQPGVTVIDQDFELPRTWSFSAGIDRALSDNVAVTFNYQHARTDNLFRAIDRNAPQLGSPFTTGDNALGALTVIESSARSRYNGITVGLKGREAAAGLLTFEANYTLAFDRSDDDNERDPFTFFYADPSQLEPEYGWSIRDRRHRANGYFLFDLGNDLFVNNIIRFQSASPASESCGPHDGNPFAPPAGERAVAPADRTCADGSVLQRNTIRRDNEFFTWDIRVSKEFEFGNGRTIEPILEVFNLTGADNNLDTSQSGLLFNFDGTIRSGLGDTRRAQLGVRFRF
ncbi:MAG: hypothetical protein MJB57_04985, partial [Gemmatimonadetes bacterium]|nr:hypothetical protein [Gemmatimonadota bacterium]